MSITAVLIDDEKNNLDNLSQLLKTYCPGVEVLATALDATEGRRIILQYQPELVFLDIQMPGKTGFDLLRELNQYDFEVIFVTAYDQYGIQAVKFAAVDYLLLDAQRRGRRVEFAHLAPRRNSRHEVP